MEIRWLLAAAQVGSVLLDHGIQPVGQLGNHGNQVGRPHHLPDLLIGGILHAVDDVVPDRACKKYRCLGYHGDKAPVAAQIQLIDVLSVDGQPPVRGCDKADQQV